MLCLIARLFLSDVARALRCLMPLFFIAPLMARFLRHAAIFRRDATMARILRHYYAAAAATPPLRYFSYCYMRYDILCYYAARCRHTPYVIDAAATMRHC